MGEPDEQHDPVKGTRMSLGEHIEELRRRLIRGLIAVVVAFAVAWAFKLQTTELIERPMRQSLAWVNADQVEKYEKILFENEDTPRSEYFLSDDPEDKQLRPELLAPMRLQALGYAEPFWYALKVTLVFAMTVGAPVLLWQMWMFVAAGLYPHERRVVRNYFPLSMFLFAAGVAFGFLVLVPYGFYFLASTFPLERVDFNPQLNSYFSLLSILTLALGVIFQLPLLMNVLVRLDLVRRDVFATYRMHFVVAAFIIGAMLTPPDPITQLLLAGPMVLLYEVGLFSTRFIQRHPNVEPEA
jgi:sec-independent protein translocase protein TatC